MIETKDIPGYMGGKGEAEYSEHSNPSRSKKVISGPLTLPADPANANKSIDPIIGFVTGASASFTLLQNKAYRVIANTGFHFRLTTEAATALATDTYVPANMPIIIETKVWTILSFIQDSAGGVIQAVEVL